MESHGTGKINLKSLHHLGKGVTLEAGVLIFHPENISILDNVYVGHNTILKAYYKNKLIIGEGTWIGQQCFPVTIGLESI